MFVSFMSIIPLSLLTRSAVFLRHLDVLGVTAEPFFFFRLFFFVVRKNRSEDLDTKKRRGGR